MDGVVAETEDFHRLAYNALFRELGLPIEWSREDYVLQLHQVGGLKIQELESQGLIPKGSAERVYGRKRRIYLDLLGEAAQSGMLPPRPGIVRLVRECRDAGLSLAVASTSAPEAVQRALEGAFGEDPRRMFSPIIDSMQVKALKPDPEAYRKACEGLGIPPAGAIAIEDTRHGLASALGAGLACLVTPSEFTVGQDFSGACAIVPDLDRGPRGPVTVADLRGWVDGQDGRARPDRR